MSNINRYYWLALEGPGLVWQLLKTTKDINRYNNIKVGHEIPTVFIPGFGANNFSTYFMRKLLKEKSHNPIEWIANKNNGFDFIDIQNTIEQVKVLYDTHGTRVNLVGQSLGGCYARTVANEIPDYINSVVTLGSPINGIDRVNPKSVNKYNTVVGFVDAAFLHHSQHFESFFHNPPVPTTSLYSKHDSVVEWPLSVIEETSISENIEIEGTHFGMGFNIKNIEIIADRLTQNKNWWVKFKK